LLRSTKTLPCYRFYALPGTQPPKPGLVREEGYQGPGIEVEVWAVPENEFGSFVAGVPPPLGIGSATLEDGEVVKCFICEPYGLRDALEITQFGGWRAFLASQSLPASV
jgi:allophanate hydrolase